MYQENSVADMLVAMLMSSRSTKVYRRILWERLQEKRQCSRQAYNQALYRLNKNGTLSISGEGISLLKKESAVVHSEHIVREKKTGTSIRILVSFDVPESKRRVRDWLRNQLRDWDFVMVQKSLWIGSGPLPIEFYDHVKLLNIKDTIKIFKVNKNQK